MLALSTPPAISAPMLLEHNVIYVQISVDGAGPLLVTFDPGGEEVYTTYASERLHGHAPRTVCVVTACYSAAMQALPGNPNDLDPKHDTRNGVIAGSIGPELLRHYVVRIDYRASTLTLTPAASFEPPSDAVRLPLTFDAFEMPVVPATIAGIKVPVEIDVRVGISLLFQPFLKRSGLNSAPTGVDVAIGNLPLQVSFRSSHATSGKFANPDVAGLLGNEALSHFALTLDFPHQAVYFERLEPRS